VAALPPSEITILPLLSSTHSPSNANEIVEEKAKATQEIKKCN